MASKCHSWAAASPASWAFRQSRRQSRLAFGEIKTSVKSFVHPALDSNCRLFDTAQAKEWYNEDDLGTALRQHPEVPRNELFLTTKMHPRDHGYERTKEVFEQSLKNLGTDYLDLFQCHRFDSNTPLEETCRVPQWLPCFVRASALHAYYLRLEPTVLL